MLADEMEFRNINVGDLIREHEFHAGRDEEFDAFVLDEEAEDKLMDHMEPLMGEGMNVVEFHASEFFPQRWFDLVLVLRTDNTVLYDRLEARGYSENKVGENVTAEIMGVSAEEAKEAYDEECVHELQSNTLDDLTSAVERVRAWMEAWSEEHGSGDA
jgi:adenylate kinase